MELAINVGFTDGTVVFKNKELTTKTKQLFREMAAAKNSLCRAGEILEEIQKKELYKDDFVDTQSGKPSFAEYCGTVLGISKTSAYRIMKTARVLLYPELTAKEKREPFFQSYGDTQLYTISKLDDYDEAKRFCEEYHIDELSSKKDIEEALAKFKPEEFGRNKKKGKDEPKKEIETSGEETKDSENTITLAYKDILYVSEFCSRIINEFNPNLLSGEKDALDQLFRFVGMKRESDEN